MKERSGRGEAGAVDTTSGGEGLNGDRKKAVLLLAFGGAGSLDEVEPFIRNVLKGRPLTPELLKSAKERYRLIGGRSPLLDITNSQAEALERLLRERGRALRVYVGMRYWRPYIRETIERMKRDAVDEALAIIMAPHSSNASTGGYVKAVKEALESTGGRPVVRFPGPWHTHPLFIEALTENIEAALRVHGPEKRTLVIFSAHSLPEPTLKGDPYVERLKETIEEVTKRVKTDWRLAFQSRGSGPVKWIGPSVEEVMEEAKSEGMEAVVVVPLGFVSDHVETLYDIDILFKSKAQELGLAFSRAPSLNSSEKFIKMLAEVVERDL